MTYDNPPPPILICQGGPWRCLLHCWWLLSTFYKKYMFQRALHLGFAFEWLWSWSSLFDNHYSVYFVYHHNYWFSYYKIRFQNDVCLVKYEFCLLSPSFIFVHWLTWLSIRETYHFFIATLTINSKIQSIKINHIWTQISYIVFLIKHI